MTQRPKISIYIAASIDGYIARADGSLDWLDQVGRADEDYGFKKLMTNIDAVILGRKTYDVASTVEDPYPGKKIIVLSNHLKRVRSGVQLYQGDLKQLLSMLHKEGIEHAWVDGGATLTQFLALNLVDEMIISVIPVLLGSGIPLFQEIGKEVPCKLISSESYPSGLVQLRYEINQDGKSQE